MKNRKINLKIPAAAAIIAAAMSFSSLPAFAQTLKISDGLIYSVSDTEDDQELYTGFAKNKKGDLYYIKNGAAVKNKWVLSQKSGNKYFFGNNGKATTGEAMINGKAYRFDSKGRLVSDSADPWGVTLKIHDSSPKELNLMIDRVGGNVKGTLSTDGDFWLERLNDSGDWEKLGYRPEYVQLSDNYTVEIMPGPGHTTFIQQTWGNMYGELSPGKYRIAKVFRDEYETDADTMTLYADFEIFDSSEVGYITLKAADITDTKLTLVINTKKVKSGITLNLYPSFYIQRLEDTGWEDADHIDQVFWCGTPDELEAGRIYRRMASWDDIYGKLGTGKYRIVKPFDINGERKELTADFTIQ